MADPSIDEAYEEYKKDRSSTTKKIQKSFSRKQIIIITLICGIAAYLIFVKKIFKPAEGLILVAVLAVVIWLLTNKDDAESKVIPMKEAMAIVRKELEHMQKKTNQIPQGEINLPPIAKLKEIEGIPKMWRVAAEIDTLRHKHKQYIVEIEAYEGYIVGMYETPRGFSEIDKPALKFIPSKELGWRHKYDLDEQDFKDFKRGY